MGKRYETVFDMYSEELAVDKEDVAGFARRLLAKRDKQIHVLLKTLKEVRDEGCLLFESRDSRLEEKVDAAIDMGSGLEITEEQQQLLEG